MTEEEAIRKAAAHLRSSIGDFASSGDPAPLSIRRTNRGNGWFVEFRLPTGQVKIDPISSIVLVRDDGITETMPML